MMGSILALLVFVIPTDCSLGFDRLCTYLRSVALEAVQKENCCKEKMHTCTSQKKLKHYTVCSVREVYVCTRTLRGTLGVKNHLF